MIVPYTSCLACSQLVSSLTKNTALGQIMGYIMHWKEVSFPIQKLGKIDPKIVDLHFYQVWVSIVNPFSGKIEQNLKCILFQVILKKFLSAVFTGTALEFSATCWGYVCGILKLTRFAQVWKPWILKQDATSVVILFFSYMSWLSLIHPRYLRICSWGSEIYISILLGT